MLGLGLAFEKISQNIPWNYLFSETIRKRAIRYLLHRYVGQFLLEKLSLDQLTIDISSGTGIIKDLALDVQSLNDVANQLNLPFKFLGGYIGEIFVNIPWRNLLSENCFVGISGLKLILHPKQMDSDISLVDSMIESMTSSMQLAQECLNEVSKNDCSENSFDDIDGSNVELETNSIDAIENFAQAIDTILNKIKIRFTDTVIKLQYETLKAHSGIGLEVRIDKIDYFDEAGVEKDHSEAMYFESSSFTCKKFLIEGVSLFTHEYLTKNNRRRESSSNAYGTRNSNEDSFKEVSDIGLSRGVESQSIDTSYFLSDNLILIGKLYNRQEIKLRLKKNEAVSGPKIEFQAYCGTLIFFLSPRQIHLLLELFEGIGAPELDKNYSGNKSKSMSQKPMNQSDFHKLERDLIQHVSSANDVPNASLNLQDCWSSPSDMYSEEKFLPLFSGKEKKMHENDVTLTSSFSTEVSDMNKSFRCTEVTNDFDKKTRDVVNSFKAFFSTLGIIIIHDDILLPSNDGLEIFMSNSLSEMQNESNIFFNKFGNFTNADNCYNQYCEVVKKFDAACNHSHLRIIGTSVSIDENENVFSNNWEMKVNVNIGWFELAEYLHSAEEPPINTKILSFLKSHSSNSASYYIPMEPKIKILMNSSHKINSKEKLCRVANPKLEVDLYFDDCEFEIDISIVDRINSLLNKQKVIMKDKSYSASNLPSSHFDNQDFFNEIIDDIKSKPESEVYVRLKCNKLNTKLCFPIPDLRPFSDISRIPWWKRNIRSEMLIIEMNDFQLNSSFCLLNILNFEVLCNELHILFQEKKNSKLLSILRAFHTPGIEAGFNPIRILIQCFPSNASSWLEDEPTGSNQDIMTKSMFGFLEDVGENVADLFNKRKVASHQHNIINELIIPADHDETSKFIDDTLRNVQYNVDIAIPNAQFILPSKITYEKIYNRLVSDLLLWVPSAPSKGGVCPLQPLNSNEFRFISDGAFDINQSHVQPFKAMPFSNDEEVENEKDVFYHSVHEHFKNLKSVHTQKSDVTNKQTLFGLKCKIHNAIGKIQTPYRNTENKIVTGKHGSLSFTFEKGFIFIASGYKGDIDSCQGIVSLDKLNLSHSSENISNFSPVILNSKCDLFEKDMKTVLYQTDNLCGIGGGKNTFSIRDSVTVCFKAKFDQARNEKTIELTGNIFGLTLRHFMISSNEDWMSQVVDFFNVEDYPIEGYTWPDVLTELNINFDHCSIDYRPINLPLKSYIAIDSLAILSNLTIKGNNSVLSLMIEDAALFLSQNSSSKKVKLKDDYVCVADLGVFELCIKLQNNSTSNPIQELLFSNNIIHIRTCSDSFKALLELLIYLANEGDLVSDAVCSENICSKNSELPTNSGESCKKEKSKCYDIVENMMQEAMVESDLKDKSPDPIGSKENVDIFLFPDEGLSKLKQPVFQSSRYRTSSSGSMESALKEALEEDSYTESPKVLKHETEEEFCVLDNVPGTGIRSPSGNPKARHLKMDFVSIKDGHFDQIDIHSLETHVSTPKHFPKPILKYNLQEVTIVWNMYGGNDFSASSESQAIERKKLPSKVRLLTSSKNPDPVEKISKSSTVSFAKGEASIIPDPSYNASSNLLQQRNNAKWFIVGGPNRCHNVLMEIQLSKIRFNYEIYPLDTPYESHHLLTVNDIEIRDRLLNSNINKFLYQFCSESLPKQASSNMMQVRAITKRSESASDSSETSLSIAVRPVRLNIDQDALIFLNEFIQHVLEDEKDIEHGEEERVSVPTYSPVLTVNYSNPDSGSEDVLVTEQESSEGTENSPPSPTYFRNVVFSPDVPIRIDYHGKHIDINSQYGALAGLIIGLGQLNQSEITLKRVELKSGVLGVEKLLNTLLNEWMYDIKKNQLPSILGGVGPMHSFVKLFQGIKDFIWLPIEQYNKDGRVIRGLQRGTSAFTTSSAYAVLDLTGRFVECIQSAAETMYDVVSSGPSVRTRPYKTKKGQPKDIREGVATAYGIVKSGLGDTASNIIKVASEEHSHKGVSGVVGGVLRQIPPSVVQPIILASEATCTVIGGMTNQLVPDARKEAVDKWKA